MAMANNGRAKLVEECGELLQVLGKVDAFGLGEHPDGKGLLIDRLEQEIADVQAAAKFVIETHNLTTPLIIGRTNRKLAQFRVWHEEDKGGTEHGTLDGKPGRIRRCPHAGCPQPETGGQCPLCYE